MPRRHARPSLVVTPLLSAALLLTACGEGSPVVNAAAHSGGAFCIGPASNHSEGCTELRWPDGPEDEAKGAPDGEAKFKTCGSLWACVTTACGEQVGPECVVSCLGKGSSAAVPRSLT